MRGMLYGGNKKARKTDKKKGSHKKRSCFESTAYFRGTHYCCLSFWMFLLS